MRHLFFLFLYLILISCGSHTSTMKGRFDSLSPIDTTCRKEVNAAKTDFSNGKMVYCNFIGMLTTPLRFEKELIGKLNYFNIKFRDEIISDVVTDQTQGCYCDFMKEEIERRYGGNFLDSLFNISESLYLIKHIDDTIESINCDIQARYPNDHDTIQTESSEVFQKEFDSVVKYPVGYHKHSDPNVSAFVNVDFVVNKNGQADILSYYFLFDIESNLKYKGYFQEQLLKIIRSQGWTPAKIRNQYVISETTLRVYLE